MARILLIDDEPLIRTLLRTGLESSGHWVTEAADGERGLALQFREPADLVMCDLNMPGTGGLEVLRQLRKASEVPVVVMTGGSIMRPGMPPTAEVLSLGACAVLCKPFKLAQVLAAVDAALASPNILAAVSHHSGEPSRALPINLSVGAGETESPD